jgi:hypothetical protein
VFQRERYACQAELLKPKIVSTRGVSLVSHSLWVRRTALAILLIAPVTTGAAANTPETNTANVATPGPAATPAPEPAVAPEPAAAPLETSVLSEENASHFLDRLMRAESAGRDTAANPRSTALGAFQFIKSTFLDVARRHFTEEIDDMTEREILALRTNRDFSRRAALAYTHENAAFLAERGVEPTLARLRLAYLLGPAGAVQLVQAPSSQPVTRVFSRAVVRANPFMSRMKATDLIAKAEREMAERGTVPAAATPVSTPRAPSRAAAKRRTATVSTLRCRRQLASCRKAMALEQRRLKARQAARRESIPAS